MPTALSLLAALLLLTAGCELSVKPFAGTIIEMTLTGVQSNPRGTHFELWARDQYDSTLRVTGIFDFTDPKGNTTRLSPAGFVVRPAITMDDPCMINANGDL